MYKRSPTRNSVSCSHKNDIYRKNKSILCDGVNLQKVDITFKTPSVEKPYGHALKMVTQNLNHYLNNELQPSFYSQRTNFHEETLLSNDVLQKNSEALNHISQTVEIPERRKQERLQTTQKQKVRQSIQLKKTNFLNKQIIVQNTCKHQNGTKKIYQVLKHYSPLKSERNLQKEPWISNKTFKFQHNKSGQLRRKLKKSLLCAYFATIIERTYRKKCIIMLKMTINRCNQILNLYNEKYLEEQKKLFMQNIAKQILHYIKRKDYLKQDQSLIYMCGANLGKANIINITRLFHQNLELMTRQNNFLKILQSEMILHLFYNSKRTTTFFVGQRCHFYDKKKEIFSISIDQKVVIGLEYFFFKFLLPYIQILIEEIEQESIQQKKQVFSYFLTIPCLFHKQFVNKFQKLQKIKKPNGNMVYINFNLQQITKDQFNLKLFTENILNGNPDNLIEGLTDFVAFDNLEKESALWKNQMHFLFDRICQNFASLMDPQIHYQ